MVVVVGFLLKLFFELMVEGVLKLVVVIVVFLVGFLLIVIGEVLIFLVYLFVYFSDIGECFVN